LAKAQEIHGFNPEGSLRECLIAIFNSRIEEIYTHFSTLYSDKDIEVLHRTRISARRVKALLKIFRPLFPEKKYRGIYQIIDNFIKTLGPIRELDVMILMLTKYISKYLQEDVKALLLFLAKLKNENLKLRAGLSKSVELKQFAREKEFLLSITSKIDKSGKNGKPPHLNVFRSFIDNTKIALPFLYDGIIEYSVRVLNKPRNKYDLHRMRIKTKPIRYLLEIFPTGYSMKTDEIYRDIKLFVEKTGDIHDADVMCARLEDFLQELRIFNKNQKLAKEKIATKPIREYMKMLKESRTDNYNLVCSMLYRWESDNFKGKMTLQKEDEESQVARYYL